MPLLFSRHPFPQATFGLWQIAEDEAFFRADLPLSVAEEVEFARLKGIRRQEWLAARWLLHKLTGESIRLPLAKDAFSKPFFPDNEHLSCSLSHSHGIVGALLRSTRSDGFRRVNPAARSSLSRWSGVGGGCDIQMMVEKMTRLAPKFLSDEEAAFVAGHNPVARFDLLHIFWTAKESLYKAYGLKALDFRAHLRLEPFDWDGIKGEGLGRIEKDVFRQPYRLWFEKLQLPDGQELVWTVCEPF